ncbi:hypothetical protein MGWOODY_Smn2742 [hydrothermal vent metagenome]|uniref:Uncharacterized protein n=1 Tax=hydrothermal vent metagenome TaxID=652676 RepID=A0A160TKZ2_9ZZZZ
MAARQRPGEHGIERQDREIDCRHPARAADPFKKEACRDDDELEREADRHHLHDARSARDELVGDPHAGKHRRGEEQQHQRGHAAEDERKGKALPQYGAGALQVARAIGTRGMDEHARQRGEPGDDCDEGQRPAGPQRRDFLSAGKPDHDHVGDVQDRPIEAGQHHRPGQPEDTPGLVTDRIGGGGNGHAALLTMERRRG